MAIHEPRRLWITLRSLIGLVAAIATVVVVNLAGAHVSDAVGLHAGTPRLAVDLGWFAISGIVATAVLLRSAAVARAMHAWGWLLGWLTVAGYAAWQMRDDWPAWFSLGVLLSLPMQVRLGWRWAMAGLQYRAPHR